MRVDQHPCGGWVSMVETECRTFQEFIVRNENEGVLGVFEQAFRISWSFRCYFFGDTFPSETSFRRGHRPNFLGNGFPGFDGVKVPGILKVVWDARYCMGPPIQNEWIYLYTQHIGQQLLTFTTTLWQTYSYLNFLTATLHNYWLGTFCPLFLVPHVAFSEVCTMPRRSLCVMKLRRMKCRLETQLAFAFFPKQSVFTPPTFNMELERKSPEKEVPLGNHHFQVPC